MERSTTVVALEDGFGKTHGIFKRGATAAREKNPLLVLLHGGGTNAAYFDNSLHSIPNEFSALGFDVLNINRVGYGGNPVPASEHPIFDSIPLYSTLISRVYKEHSDDQGGVILIGHSLGAAISIILAAQETDKLPILGVSALGIIPIKEPLDGLTEALTEAAKNLPGCNRVRRPLLAPAEKWRRFMGEADYYDRRSVFDSLPEWLETGLKSELVEWLDPNTYERFVTEIAPSVRVPLQYLAAEIELSWSNIEEGRPIFEAATKLFCNAPAVDADILPRGAHNFEFCRNSGVLRDRRLQFIRDLIERKDDPAAFTELPILDLSLVDSPETRGPFLEQLRQALVNVGFFYVKNSSIPKQVTEKLIEKGIELFNLPLEEKLKIEMVNSKHFLGYARLGAETTTQNRDFREQFDFATELPAPEPHEPPHRNLRGPNQWPSETTLSGIKAAIETYLSEATKLSSTLTSLIAEALSLPATAFANVFESTQQNKLKLIKYPNPESDPKNTQGVGPHQDSGFLTLLLQATEHVGLEVQNKRGEWIEAPPIRNTLVINIGRALEALTVGVCTATTHRVKLSASNFISADGRPLGPRYSFPVFQGVSIDLSAKDIDIEIPQHVRDLVKDEAVKSKAEQTFGNMFSRSIGEGTFMARLTSHQDVGARWYPELLEQALQAQKGYGK